jgi:hypothetical protein
MWRHVQWSKSTDASEELTLIFTPNFGGGCPTKWLLTSTRLHFRHHHDGLKPQNARHLIPLGKHGESADFLLDCMTQVNHLKAIGHFIYHKVFN